MLQKNKGLFIISLDFELLWGVRDKRSIDTYGENIRGVRKAIPALLELFDTYGIHATFATVGFLFARNKEELQQYVPANLPRYDQRNYSPYENDYLSAIGNNEEEDIYHYGSSLIRMILQHPDQEIATHTFSHFYCLENASLESFKADLQASIKIAATYNINLKSIIFPRNQYSRQHLDICKKLGFTSYRGNEPSFLYSPRRGFEISQPIRAAKLIDSYFNITGHHSFTLDTTDTIINIPASRFLRSYTPKLKLLDHLRLDRIKNSMTYAAQNNQGYHLWWHPHNFGTYLQENLHFLQKILEHYKILNSSFGMQSKNMKEIAQDILLTHAE